MIFYGSELDKYLTNKIIVGHGYFPEFIGVTRQLLGRIGYWNGINDPQSEIKLQRADLFLDEAIAVIRSRLPQQGQQPATQVQASGGVRPTTEVDFVRD